MTQDQSAGVPVLPETRQFRCKFLLRYLPAGSRRRLAISLRRRPPEAKATITIALSQTSRKPLAQVASNFASTSLVTALALLRSRGSRHGEAYGLLEGRGSESAIEAAPPGQRRPVRQPPAHRCGCVWTTGFQEALVPEVFIDRSWHAVIRVALALVGEEGLIMS